MRFEPVGQGEQEVSTLARRRIEPALRRQLRSLDRVVNVELGRCRHLRDCVAGRGVHDGHRLAAASRRPPIRRRCSCDGVAGWPRFPWSLLPFGWLSDQPLSRGSQQSRRLLLPATTPDMQAGPNIVPLSPAARLMWPPAIPATSPAAKMRLNGPAAPITRHARSVATPPRFLATSGMYSTAKNGGVAIWRCSRVSSECVACDAGLRRRRCSSTACSTFAGGRPARSASSPIESPDHTCARGSRKNSSTRASSPSSAVHRRGCSAASLTAGRPRRRRPRRAGPAGRAAPQCRIGSLAGPRCAASASSLFSQTSLAIPRTERPCVRGSSGSGVPIG